ncbi:hypothetical protein M0804_013693 [Polistes exclamans]|nr:hypothetical protein M0804_013693 [Polistes exclamans]
MQNKKESPNTEESLEELKRTVLELKENLTRRNENSERNKAIEKAILNNKENEKQTEEDSLKRISKNKRKKDPSFLQSKSQKHTELSSAAALVNGNVNNAKLSWLNEAESPEEMIESDKSLNNIKNQDRSVILLRNKRTNLKNDLFNEREMNLYKRKKRSKGNINKDNNFKEDSYYDKANKDTNNYWKRNNYKELTNVDDLIAQQAKLLHYDNTNNNKNVLSETEQVIKRKSPERRLFWIIEKESNNRSFSDNENKCFIVKKHQRRILQSYDEENLEEDFLTNEEDDSNRNEKIKVAKSCRDKKETLKIERDVKNTSENVKNPYEARVNMMIKQRIALRHKDEKNHVRRKRYPLGIIEYYDYDEEMNERSRESQIIGDNDQNNNDQNDNPIDSNFKLDANLQESLNETLMKKKNEEAEEQEKEKKRKEKQKNKEPKQQFLVDLEQQARAKNENPSESLRSKVTFAKGEDKSSQMDREKSFLNEAVQPSGQIRDEKSFVPACQTKCRSNNRRKEQDENDRTMEEPNQEFVNIDKIVPKESLEYILRAPETLQREIVDVVFGDVKPIQLPEHEKKLDNLDQTRLENRVGSKKLDEKEYDDIDNVYDELKKLYDWEDNENKNGPRLKGDQRMHLDASEDDLEIKTNTNDNNNNNNNSNNTSESNYLALKKTDDLFKGGLEQSDIFEERSSNKTQNHHHHQNLSNNYAGNIEWKVIPVVETINDSRSKSSGVVRSGLSERKTAPENDSGSPYENGKYHDSMNELEENVRNVIDGDKRSVLESKDMHESFVEPMDRIDDFDDDIKVRLGRGLKTIDDNYFINGSINNYTNQIILLNEYSTTTIKTTNISTKYEITNHFYSSPSSSSSSDVENINDNSNLTVKEQIEEINNKKIGNNSNVNSIDRNSSRFNLTFKPQTLANRNASRIKRDGNSYSLNYNQGKNPYKTYYYKRSKDLSNDLYTINPYQYKDNKDTELKYNNDINDLYNEENKEDISKDTNIQDRNRKKKKKRRNRMHKNKKKKKKRKKMKNQKKKKKKKKKKNSNWKMSKKRARNLNNEFDDLFSDSIKSKRKRWKNNPILNYRNNDWKDRVKKWQQHEKIRNKMKMNKMKKNRNEKKRKEMEKMKMKTNRGTVKGIRRNSNNDGIIQKDNANDRNTMRKKETENEDTRRKKLAMLLTADNMEDESQMDLALHGELAGKIIKHTEKTMKKIMELLGRLVLDEVQSKTCAKIPSDMQQFLEWMLQVKGEKELYEQTPLLPLVHDQETTEHPVDDDKIFIPKTSDEEIDKDVNEFQKKVRILQNLINEYNALSAKEKIKVQTVHDYLVRQLNLLLHYIEMKEKSKKNDTIDVPQTEGVRSNAEFILHYQGESPKLKFDDNVTLIKDPNVSEFWKLNNSRFSLDIERNKRRPVRSNYDNYVRNKKKRKKRKKRKRKRRRRRNEVNYDRRDTPEYQKLARRAAMIREKRDDNLEDEWNQFDFKYEQPKIYKSMSIMNDPIEKIRNERSTDLQQKEREILKTDNVTITNFYNNNFDDLPVKGKNLAEDEMILLNKREAWKKENERQLEEVAFGKDMRNKIREEEQFKILTGIKGKRMANEKNKLREKRENIKEKQHFIRSNSNNVTLSINATTVSYNELTIAKLSSNFVDTKIISLVKRNDTNENEEKLKIMKRKINVFADDTNETSIMNKITT